jgi:hypothetical protein
MNDQQASDGLPRLTLGGGDGSPAIRFFSQATQDNRGGVPRTSEWTATTPLFFLCLQGL